MLGINYFYYSGSQNRGKIDCFLRPRTHHAGEIWKRSFHYENGSNVLRPYDDGGIKKCNNHHSGISRDYRDVIVVEKLHFQNVLRPHENKKLRFRDGLVWSVRLTVEITQHFQIPPGSVIISYRSTPRPARVNFFVFSGPVWGWPRSRWSKQLCLTVL